MEQILKCYFLVNALLQKGSSLPTSKSGGLKYSLFDHGAILEGTHRGRETILLAKLFKGMKVVLARSPIEDRSLPKAFKTSYSGHRKQHSSDKDPMSGCCHLSHTYLCNSHPECCYASKGPR